MRLPGQSSSYHQRVRYGRYVVSRLRQAKLAERADPVEAATAQVKAAGRAVEDAQEPVLAAMALRDASDADMDEATQHFRLQLASRKLNANKEPPYTQIFHKGIGYYIAAPLSANVDRYKELISRVEANLPEGDESRTVIVGAVAAGLESFGMAVTDLATARTDLAMARTELDTAEDEWNNLVEKTFGLLITDFGKKGANRFFPKMRSVRNISDNDDDTAAD